jgi:hypothetical protein
MIFVIPASILMMIFGGHEAFLLGLKGIGVGVEFLAYGFIAGLAFFLLKWLWVQINAKLNRALAI